MGNGKIAFYHTKRGAPTKYRPTAKSAFGGGPREAAVHSTSPRNARHRHRLNRSARPSSSDIERIEMSARTSFKYVYIPADSSSALEELTMEIPEGKEIECLLDTLKEHFRSAGGTVGTKAEQQAKFKAQLEEQSGKKIDDNLMDIASRMQMVQPVALLPGGAQPTGSTSTCTWTTAA